MTKLKKHKNHSKERKTVCGIKYDNVKDMPDFIFNNLAGWWKRVTCKNCLKIGKGSFTLFGIFFPRKLMRKERKEILNEAMKVKQESRLDYALALSIIKVFDS